MRCVRLLTALLLLLACRTTAPENGKRVEVRIRPGMTFGAVTDSLLSRGVIDNRLRFQLLGRLHGYPRRVRPGRYHLLLNSDEARVLKVLSREVPVLLMVTIPEGRTMAQIATALAEDGICDSKQFLATCRDTVLLRELGVPGPTAEGFLFPETYEMGTAEKPEDIVRRMVQQCFTVLRELKATDSAGRPGRPSSLLTPPSSVLTLASIVEKEAQVPAEFPRIAGVFANRLRRRIPLQSCATIQYALPERKDVLAVEDTKYPSPYNTYLHTGLPPGPICNPGRRALAAAMRPERHDYIFFVSRGDGTHVFSRTAAEHNAACARVRNSS